MATVMHAATLLTHSGSGARLRSDLGLTLAGLLTAGLLHLLKAPADLFGDDERL